MELGRLGSMEAIQQLGRFLYDERNPDGGFWPPDTEEPNSHPNYGVAAEAIHRALGASSPFKTPWEGGPPRAADVQRWWESEASRPYREWNAEEYEPMPPPRRRALSSATAVKSTAQGASPMSATTPPGTVLPVWLMLVLCVAGIAAVTWFAARRGRGAR